MVNSTRQSDVARAAKPWWAYTAERKRTLALGNASNAQRGNRATRKPRSG